MVMKNDDSGIQSIIDKIDYEKPYKPAEAAEIIGIGKQSLDSLRKTGKIGYLEHNGYNFQYTGEHIVNYLRSINKKV